MYHAKCYCQLPKEDRYTDCKPVASDFDYWCQVKYGRSYGYKNILKGREGCCGIDGRLARAKCSTSAHGGFNVLDRPIKCIPTNNYFNHLEECQKTYPQDSINMVKGIAGYNCNPGYFKSQCVYKKL